MEKSEIFGYMNPIAIREPKNGLKADGKTPYSCITVMFKPEAELYEGTNPKLRGRLIDTGAPATSYTFFQGDIRDSEFFNKFKKFWDANVLKAVDVTNGFGDTVKEINDRELIEDAMLMPIPAYRHCAPIKSDAKGLPYVFQIIRNGKPSVYGAKHVDAGKPVVVTHFTTLVIKGGKTAQELEDAWIDRNLGDKARIEMLSLKQYKTAKVAGILSAHTEQTESLEPVVATVVPATADATSEI